MSLVRAAACLLGITVTASAQYTTRLAKPADKPTLRSVAVLEWTGDLAKPSSSRLVPIAVWDGEHYQPGGEYLAQPAPLALLTGTQYELEKAGEPAGFFNVRSAATLNGGWVGLGRYQPVPPPPPPPELKVSKRLPAPTPTTQAKVADTADAGDRPTLHRKTEDAPAGPPTTTAPTSAPTTAPDATPSSDKPTLHRRADTDTGTTSSDPDKPSLHRKDDAGSTTETSDDPDRPTLHRRSDTPAPAPDVDPDRPTLHKAPRAEAGGSDVGSAPGTVSGTTAIDPDRPTLRRGKPEALDTALAPTKLESTGLPIRQMVAVSDVRSADPREYLYHWSTPEDEARMRAAMEALALKALGSASAAAQAATFGPAAKSQVRAGARSAKVAKTLGALVDEAFASYELSFSSGPTVVLSARGGTAGDRYVTLIAQPDFYGQPRVLFRQVSSAATLEETPRMQLVDAVDTNDDHQAELIFELFSSLPAQGSTPARQYAIYRVTAAGAEQVFTTGPLL